MDGPMTGALAAVDRLAAFGWDDAFAASFSAEEGRGRSPGRVTVEDRGRYLVETAHGERRAVVSGRFRYDAAARPDAFPAVGDWVALDVHDNAAVIHGLVDRRTAIVRHGAGRRSDAQVVAANVDLGLVVTSVNREFNLRRLERYVAVVWESGAVPVVVLSKADLAADADDLANAAASVAPGVRIVLESAVDGRGLAEIRSLLAPGRTVAVLGSSGVGKSTLVNALAGEPLEPVSAIRLDDDRGHHTTRRRHLHRLPDGALVLDTPGMRELGLLDGDGVEASFTDVLDVATGCRFADCAHHGEPGCAVRSAIERGELDAERFESYRKLEREAAHAERKANALARIAEQKRWKAIHRSVRRQMQERYGDGT